MDFVFFSLAVVAALIAFIQVGDKLKALDAVTKQHRDELDALRRRMDHEYHAYLNYQQEIAKLVGGTHVLTTRLRALEASQGGQAVVAQRAHARG